MIFHLFMTLSSEIKKILKNIQDCMKDIDDFKEQILLRVRYVEKPRTVNEEKEALSSLRVAYKSFQSKISDDLATFKENLESTLAPVFLKQINYLFAQVEKTVIQLKNTPEDISQLATYFAKGNELAETFKKIKNELS